MKITYGFYPGGKHRALTMSYDDGREFDRRLVSIFDTYGIRGTFHLNSGFLGGSAHVSAAELDSLYKNHEISSHSVTHPFLERLPSSEIMRELTDDRITLENASGRIVRGMSYPYGTYSDNVISIARACGMEYSRTTLSTGAFGMPDDFLRWHPTCHHGDRSIERLDDFAAFDARYGIRMPLFYCWGHSYEFNDSNNWELIERFCEKAARLGDTAFMTNIEIVDYMTALHALRFSADSSMVYNPAATPVTISVDGAPVEIKPGNTLTLK